jgi:hypothetical protein
LPLYLHQRYVPFVDESRAASYLSELSILTLPSTFLPQIVWPEEWTVANGNNVPRFLLSVDGLHCRKFEPAHPTLPKNKKVSPADLIHCLSLLAFVIECPTNLL